MKLLQNLREVFGTLKRRKPAKIFCPRCGSPKIHLSSSLDYWLTPRKYVCDDCGYVGILVMELEKEEES
ncbi:MAG: hypothetical protein QHH18_04330 [Candidatus Bathyarchaeota archaeon]|nr:hypothetical protein [Candidatus Bathyarchaeota archaeon A05DMB-5]MDH7557816.1 hypothetical protein [Candidatus Bathyarchaeota archaeon]